MGESAATSSVANDYYNHGMFNYGVVGSGTTVFGTIYVSYVVELFHPQPSVGLSTVYALSGTSGSAATIGTVLTGFIIRGFATSVIVPAGTWKVEWYLNTDTSIANMIFSVGSGCTLATARTAIGTTTGITYNNVKSDGSTNATLTCTPSYGGSIINQQVRLVRTDAVLFSNSAIFV